MKTLEQAFNIIRGSKRFSFEYGEFGSTVLVIQDYRTGEELRLDLANLDEDSLETLQVEGISWEENDYEED